MGHNQNYVPVTLDELMERFIHNIKRNKKVESFEDSSKLLFKQHLRFKTDE